MWNFHLLRVAVVRCASCNLQCKACSGVSSAGEPALAIYGKEAQHSSLIRARAASRWLRLAHISSKGAAPAKTVSISARSHGAICQVRPLSSPSWLLRVKQAHVRLALGVSGEKAQQSSLLLV